MRLAALALLLVVTACAAEEVAPADPCLETAESVAGCQAAVDADPRVLPATWTASAECHPMRPKRADGSTYGSSAACNFVNGWMCCQ